MSDGWPRVRSGFGGAENGDDSGDGEAGGAVRSGHRLVPHTADLALEAWAPTRDECIAEAVRALVDSVAELPDTVPREEVMFALDEAADEDLLAAVLDEVIYQMDVHGRLPADVSIDERTGATAGQVEVRFVAVPVDEVTVVGAVPKAVSLHELRFARAGGAWRCHVTVDV